jgi:hypothetical protein
LAVNGFEPYKTDQGYTITDDRIIVGEGISLLAAIQAARAALAKKGEINE